MDKDVLKFLADMFKYLGAFSFSSSLELFGAIIERDYCLNWWYKEEEKKIEITLFTPLPDVDLDYNQMQEKLAKRFSKSGKVSKVMRVGARRIDVYLK